MKATPRLLRNVSTNGRFDDTISNSKKRTQRTPAGKPLNPQAESKVTVKFFEQTPDGARKEIQDDPRSDEAIEEAINAKIQALGAELEKIQKSRGRRRLRLHKQHSFSSPVKEDLEDDGGRPNTRVSGKSVTYY